MAMVECSGVCTHGRTIVWCGNSVVFTEGGCADCAAQLRREGYDVSVGTVRARVA